MVVNPITIGPDATLADALALMSSNHISGIPVVENGGQGRPPSSGELVGILTNRDVRFATNPNQPHLRADDATRTSSPCATASARTKPSACSHAHRIEKLLVIDDDGRCVGLITVKDIEKAQLNPNAVKDAQGRLRVARRDRSATPASSARWR